MGFADPPTIPLVDVSVEAKQVAHDLLLDLTADHPADCAFCKPAKSDREDAPVAEITDADVSAAVAKAVSEKEAELQAQIDDLKAQLDNRDTEAKIADLQAQLDEASIARKAAEDNLTAVTDYLAAVAADQAAAAEREAVKAERIQAVKDLDLFHADHVEARIADNAERWATMSDDDWAVQLADYQSLKDSFAGAPSGGPAGKPAEPQGSAIGAPVADTLDNGRPSVKSLINDIIDNRNTVNRGI